MNRIQHQILDLVLGGAIAVSTIIRRANTRRRPPDGQIRLLIEPSDYILRNAGDMAMMQIAVERLAALWPDASIQVLTDDPQTLKTLCPRASPFPSEGRQIWLSTDFLPRGLRARTSHELVTQVRLRAPELVRLLWKHKLRREPARWRALDDFINAVAESDAVIVTGMGGITDAFPEYAHDLLVTLSLALWFAKPVALVGQGIGPLELSGLRELAGSVLRRVDLIALREDLAGGPLLKSLRVPTETVATTGDDAIEIAFRTRSSPAGTGLGINIRASDYSEVDLELVLRLRIVLQQVLHGLNAVAVPVPISSVPGEEDLGTFRDLMHGYEGTTVESPNVNMPYAVVEQLRHCRILVCGSYHASVFACSAGIPAVCLAKSKYYRAKFRGLADLFGEGCEVISLDNPHFEFRLREAINRCWTNAEQLRPHLLERAEAQMAIGRAAYQRLFGLISARIDREKTGWSHGIAMDYNTFGVVLRALRCRWFGTTDLGRWRDSSRFDSDWEERAKLIASLVPKNSTIIDFGAGQRTLERHLDPSCSYIPSDLVGRGSDTIVFDLNERPLPDLSYLALDVATLAGVVEYINDVPAFVRWLARQTSTCIVSYECAQNGAGTWGRLLENMQRTGAGWVNTYTENELLLVFKSCGFEIANRISWLTPQGEEQIFAFTRTERSAG